MGFEAKDRRIAYSYSSEGYQFNIYHDYQITEVFNFDTPFSHHILFILKGTAELQSEMECLSLSEGDIVLIKNSPEMTCKSSEDYQALCLSYETPITQKMLGLDLEEITGSCEEKITKQQYSKEKFEQILTMIHEFLFQQPLKVQEENLHFLLAVLFEINMDDHNVQYYQQQVTQIGKVERMIALIELYMNNSYQERITTDKLSQIFSISRTHLCTVFKEITGFTINQYINELRVKKAQEALKITSSSIMDISYFIGYHSVSQFNRQFKQITGLTPTEYRNEVDTYLQ